MVQALWKTIRQFLEKQNILNTMISTLISMISILTLGIYLKEVRSCVLTKAWSRMVSVVNVSMAECNGQKLETISTPNSWLDKLGILTQ